MIEPTINDGPMPTSRMPGCSRFTWPGNQRDSLDEETTDWRAVCEKTARTVRRAGLVQADPDPYHTPQRSGCDAAFTVDLGDYGSPPSRGRHQPRSCK